MPKIDHHNAPLIAAAWAVFAVLCFSTNDVLVKVMAGGLPLYQVMFVRTVVGLIFIVAVLVPITGETLRTTRLRSHMLRGLCVLLANFLFFLGLAAMPLAEATAIFFVSPFLISAFSSWFLGEKVGPRRWLAIAVGMVGVLIVLRPGSQAFQLAALLPLLAAVAYALLHTMTRFLGATENATAMAFYIQMTFLAISASAGLALGDGRFDTFDHPSAEFLLRAWTWPTTRDLILMSLLGVTSSVGGYAIGQAFRKSEAAFVAPFEYIAMPIAVFWGLTVFGEWPDNTALAGIALILASGLFLVWREAIVKRRAALDGPRRL